MQGSEQVISVARHGASDCEQRGEAGITHHAAGELPAGADQIERRFMPKDATEMGRDAN